MWLENTHHRDLDDLLMYKTTRVYTTPYLKGNFIVADRMLLLANNKYTDKGDTKKIHIGDIELFTLVYQEEQQKALQHTSLNVSVVPDEDQISDELMHYLRGLPPSQDPMREFVLAAGIVVMFMPDIKLPKTHKMAMKSAEAAQWQLAEQSELDSMITHEVFTHMVLPPGKKTIKTRWVYVLKYKNGAIAKYKALLVAKGN